MNSASMTTKFFLLKYGCANAAVWSLDVKQCAHGGGDVGHVGQARGLTGSDVPAHEDERNVGIALAP